jgi:hypothetical protein
MHDFGMKYKKSDDIAAIPVLDNAARRFPPPAATLI